MKETYIIAEAGVNHNGSLRLAKQMVQEAKKAGADAVKFQTFQAGNLVTKYAEKAKYQKKSADFPESQYQMLRSLELVYDDFLEIKALCDSENIEFLSTPFDLESIELLEAVGLTRYKIPSGAITDYPYLKRIAETHKPVILSTGMSAIDEIEDALLILQTYGTTAVTLLHCNTQYPTPAADVNLTAMCTLREKFHVDTGYSDHTLGMEVAIAAVAMGAKVIEKHFTLDKSMKGPDHKASMDVNELTAMIAAIRNVEKALGDGQKKPSPSEMENISAIRKSIVAKRDIQKGELLKEDNLTTKRPGTGLSPMLWNEIIGTEAIKNFSEDQMIEI